MERLILLGFSIFFAVVGFVELYCWVVTKLTGGTYTQGYWVVPITGCEEDIESRLRRYSTAMRCSGHMADGRLIVLDLGADDEALAICNMYARKHQWLCITTLEGLGGMIPAPNEQQSICILY